LPVQQDALEDASVTGRILRSLVVVGVLPLVLGSGCAVTGSGPVTGPARAQADEKEWDCNANERETILGPAKLGQRVSDGLGVGPIRLGDPVARAVEQWGATQCEDSGGSPSSLTYIASGSGPGSSVIVSVIFAKGTVASIVLWTPPGAARTNLELRTVKGIPLLASLSDVRRIYGAPDTGADRQFRYATHGVAFEHSADVIWAMEVFPRGSPASTEALPRRAR